MASWYPREWSQDGALALAPAVGGLILSRVSSQISTGAAKSVLSGQCTVSIPVTMATLNIAYIPVTMATLYTASVPVTSQEAANRVAQGGQGSGGGRSPSLLLCGTLCLPDLLALTLSVLRWKGVLHILLCDLLVQITPSSRWAFWVVWNTSYP